MNLIAAFDGAVRKHSDKTFLRSGDVSISYGEMKARSHLAAAVLAEAGVGPGDAVALMCFNTPEFVDALLSDARLEDVAKRMRCSKCGKKKCSLRAFPPTEPRGYTAWPR
jgi:acyl-CoA synthetase (AMP-forming)/AMP-acid ligase II